MKSLSDFQAAADKANEILVIPSGEDAGRGSGQRQHAIANGNAALDSIGKQDLSKVTFASTVRAIDDIQNDAQTLSRKRSSFSKPTRTRPCGTRRKKRSRFFRTGRLGLIIAKTSTRRQSVRRYQAKLEGEDALLLETYPARLPTAGLALPPRNARKVEKLRKELAQLETDFQANIVAVKAPIVFRKAELEGVPDTILESPGVKDG